MIVRGGVLGWGSIEQAANRSFDLYGALGISVVGAIGTSVVELCRRSEQLAHYRQIRLTTFGRVRGAGFVLLATFEHPHYTLVLPDLSEITLARLERCFDDPIPNPGRAPRW